MFAPPQKIPNPQHVTTNLGWHNLFNATVFYMFLCVSMFFYESRGNLTVNLVFPARGNPVGTQMGTQISQVSYVGPALSSCLCNRQSSFTPSQVLFLTLPQAPGPSNHHRSSPLSLESLSDFTSYIEFPCNEPSSFTPFHFVSFKLPQATSQSKNICVQFLYTVSVRFLSGLYPVCGKFDQFNNLVSSLCPICVRFVSALCPVCPVCVQFVSGLYSICIRFLSGLTSLTILCSMCVRFVSNVCPVCVQCVQFVQLVFNLCPVCVQFVSGLCPV